MIHNTSKALNKGDITKATPEELGDIDVFVYSPPCQAFSVAGKQEGVKDSRGKLFYDALPIIQTKKPKYALMENVRGLTGDKFEDLFADMLNELDMAGYNNYWQVLNTKDYGIPQNRERVFVISIRKDIDSGTFEFPEPFDSGLRLKDFLEEVVDEKYYISDEKTEDLLRQLGEKGLDDRISDGAMRADRQGLKVVSGCSTRTRSYMGQAEQLEIRKDDVANSITTVQKDSMITDYQRVRKLTPKECFRLQGFTDDDYEMAKSALETTYYNGRDRSNSQMYKMAGNSITVNVLEEMYKILFKEWII